MLINLVYSIVRLAHVGQCQLLEIKNNPGNDSFGQFRDIFALSLHTFRGLIIYIAYVLRKIHKRFTNFPNGGCSFQHVHVKSR